MSVIENGTILFERYRIVSVLGKGGFSTVYLADNIKVGNLVAIKVVPSDEKDISLIAEKDMLKELRHPAIPIIIDIEVARGEIYLIEEYVEGVSLKELKLRLKEEEVIDIMRQLVDVLIYLHTSFNEPIIYRDMKPDNIIRMQGGHVKLVDFGIAKRYKKHQKKDTVQLGSRGYAAPEQYGVGKVDVRTDLYSLGVCMYYLLTGKNLNLPPYKLVPIRTLTFEVSPILERIITKCIAPVPGMRYQTAQALKLDLLSIDTRENSEQDLEVFTNHSQRIFRCLGIKKGIGTTHMSIMMARFYQEQGKSVAVIEYHSSEDFNKIMLARSDIEEKRYYFELEGVAFYPYYHYGGYHKIIVENYDVIILDCGTLSDDALEGCYKKVDTVLISGGKDWEMDYFEDYYYNNPNVHYHHCFNLVDEQGYMRIISSIEGLKCHRIPLNLDPYKPSKEITMMCEGIISEQVFVPEKLEGRIDDVKLFIKEAIKKYKKT